MSRENIWVMTAINTWVTAVGLVLLELISAIIKWRYLNEILKAELEENLKLNIKNRNKSLYLAGLACQEMRLKIKVMRVACERCTPAPPTCSSSNKYTSPPPVESLTARQQEVKVEVSWGGWQYWLDRPAHWNDGRTFFFSSPLDRK